ncbi:30751_t:CDS:10 [Gigaspora margarita]|uniref:GrpE protein homolog, mitochondrial n=1 Tax=Gigaspora margarita TaxID=4874 RepID=A0ABN7UXS7_GIGMA|nr:30751_t:CDS:10 [Gigaspora margarita]
MLVNDSNSVNSVDQDAEQEEKHFRKVLNTFALYKSYALSANNRRRKDYYALSERHRAFIPSYLEILSKVDQAIIKNHLVLKQILADSRLFTRDDKDSFCPNFQYEKDSSTHSQITDFDMDKLRSTIKQFVREWAAEGQEERDAAYKPLLEALIEFFKDVPDEERSSIRVLVPGAGLGRLAFDVVKQDQLQPIYIPDVLPSSIPSGVSFSMVAGDFVEVYGDEQYNVTCFFIDTAKNILEYIEIFHRILRPGGLWINLGPLLYHYENSPDEMSIELSLEQSRKKPETETKAEADSRDKVSETEAGIDSKDKEIALLKDKHLRCLAELENHREISRREVEMASQFAIQKFAKDILSAVDNLELALASVPPELRTEPTLPTESNSIISRLVNLYKGVYLTESELLSTLKRHGIEKIEPKLGEKFDPKIHEALYQASINGQDVGTIFDIQKIGYSLNGRILRPPQVGVVKAAD